MSAGFRSVSTATSRSQRFPEITEAPDDFRIPVQQNQQMNYRQLGDYVKYLGERGFDTQKLQVQYYEKFSVPVFGLIMAFMSVPFGFMVGNRGAMAGIGVSIAIGMAYQGIVKLFEQMGNVNYLPAEVAAWSPDALFLAGRALPAVADEKLSVTPSALPRTRADLDSNLSSPGQK